MISKPITILSSAATVLNFEHSVTVYMGNRVIGTIRLDDDGFWYYYPKGSGKRGEPFASLEQCQQSLV